MADWYYAVGQDQEGPVSEDEIRALIRTGKITRDIFVWHEGMNTWQLAGDHSDLSTAFVSPPPLPTARPVKSLPPAVESAPAQVGKLNVSRPWPRFWARVMDNLLFTPLLGFCFAVWAVWYAPEVYLYILTMNEVLFSLLVLPFVCLVLALCMMIGGTTPGKAIVGVRVPVPKDRNRVSFFFWREFKVWAAGLGLGIPLVALFTQIHQYSRLSAGKTASYDEGNPLVIANPSKVRLSAAIVVVITLFAANIALRSIDERVSNNLETTQTWVSPITEKSAVIGKTWQEQEMTTNSGQVYYFVSSDLLMEAIFGYEKLPSESVEIARYAEAIKKAIASNVSILTDWQSVTIAGLPALRATGKAVNFENNSVEVTIAINGSDAWRTIMFARGNSPAQLAEKERFVRAMLMTVK